MVEAKHRQRFFIFKSKGKSFIVKDKPVVAITASANNQPLYWDGKLIHNGFPVVSLVEIDSNGAMQRNKVIDGFYLQMEEELLINNFT